MRSIFELPIGTNEAIQAQAQGDYLRAISLRSRPRSLSCHNHLCVDLKGVLS